jgi:hypothetical protein
MERVKQLKKWGKAITYSVDGSKGSWMLITEGDQSWLHATAMNLRQESVMRDSQLTRNIVSRKGMWELLVHFGCDKEDLRNVFKKRQR